MHVRRLEQEFGDRVRIRRRTSILRATPNPDARFTELQVRGYRRARRHEPATGIKAPRLGQKYPTWSAPALETWLWAERYHPDREADVDWALYREFFTRHADISDVEVLAGIVTALGLPGESLRRSLAAEEFRERVFADEREWRERGFTKIPSIEMDGRPAMEGVLTYEQYRRLVTGEADPTALA